MAIGAFAGLRTSEIFRLDWSMVRWDQKVIAVPRKIAKKIKTARLAPMSDNLIKWLWPWREKVGPVYPHKKWRSLESAHGHEIERLKKLTGHVWNPNLLRHSSMSYRMAIVKNEAQVVYEHGTSTKMLRRFYDDPKHETEAKAWYAVLPDDKIVPLPLEFLAG